MFQFGQVKAKILNLLYIWINRITSFYATGFRLIFAMQCWWQFDCLHVIRVNRTKWKWKCCQLYSNKSLREQFIQKHWITAHWCWTSVSPQFIWFAFFFSLHFVLLLQTQIASTSIDCTNLYFEWMRRRHGMNSFQIAFLMADQWLNHTLNRIFIYLWNKNRTSVIEQEMVSIQARYSLPLMPIKLNDT